MPEEPILNVNFFVCLYAMGTLAIIAYVWRCHLSQQDETASSVEECSKMNKASHVMSCPLTGAAVLLLLCVVLRGFNGGGNLSEYPMLFPCVFALGKALGGVCCDRMGYRRTIVLIFVMSFIALQLRNFSLQGILSTLPALLMSLAFNMTMPLTLRLLHWCYPDYPGMMFGLAASCLVPGAFWHETFRILPQIMIVIQFLGLFLSGVLVSRFSVQGRKCSVLQD